MQLATLQLHEADTHGIFFLVLVWNGVAEMFPERVHMKAEARSKFFVNLYILALCNEGYVM